MFTAMNLLLVLKIILKIIYINPPIYLSICGLRNPEPPYLLHI